MRRYMHEYDVPEHGFAGFALTAHANGAGNPCAMFRKKIKPEAYAKAEMVSEPLNMFDIAPNADGAAAVLLTRRDLLPAQFPHPMVKIAAPPPQRTHWHYTTATMLWISRPYKSPRRKPSGKPAYSWTRSASSSITMLTASMPRWRLNPSGSLDAVRAGSWPRTERWDVTAGSPAPPWAGSKHAASPAEQPEFIRPSRRRCNYAAKQAGTSFEE